MAEPLFNHVQEIKVRIQAAERVLISCDFDGTLSAIVPHPKDASILPESADALRRLAEIPGYTVAVMSGRALTDIRARVGLQNVIYSGNHGIEISTPGGLLQDSGVETARLLMAGLRQALESAIADVSGAFIEDKGVSLSVHYRMAPEQLEPQVRQAVRDVTAAAADDGKIIVVQGKKVLDIRPAAARNKGSALVFVMHTLRERTGGVHLPVYIGDDTTDEDAFREVNRVEGVSILVGPPERETLAQYRMSSPGDTAQFLQWLAETQPRD